MTAGSADTMPVRAPRTIYLVAGEHSGDALGAKLMAGIQALRPGEFAFAGVGGAEMAHEGLTSLFPIEDVAVMGPAHILPALPRLVRRVYQTVDAAIAANPALLVIIDSPEFTHPIAKRIRKRAPHIRIVDYVSPSVWAWRSGRARKMRGYVDEVLALLPFEPAAHQRLGGPHCTYVGHPLIEKLDTIRGADGEALRHKLAIAQDRDVLLVLPGSRRSEVERLIADFGQTIARLADMGHSFDVVIPAVPHVKARIARDTAHWPVRVHLIDGADKYAAMRLARAALAASGTVTLELAIAGLPMVVAYKIDAVTAVIVRRLITADTAVLPNLILGEKAFPEFIQQDCTPEKLAHAVSEILAGYDARRAQLAALARIPGKLELDGTTPSEAAARATLAVLSIG